MEIIAHRGASDDAPENTLAAARLAWAQGADALECDVRLTRDGRLAVIHDADLRRVAGRRRTVAELTMEELRGIDVGAWKHPAFRGESVPELDAVLVSAPAPRRIFVELKGGAALVPELARVVRRTAFGCERLVIISFQLAAVADAKRVLPEAEVCWIVERPWHGAPEIGSLVDIARAARLDGLDLEYRLAPDARAVQQVHAAGLRLYVWTVDDPHRARRCAEWKIDGLATNRPAAIRAELERGSRAPG